MESSTPPYPSSQPKTTPLPHPQRYPSAVSIGRSRGERADTDSKLQTMVTPPLRITDPTNRPSLRASDNREWNPDAAASGRTVTKSTSSPPPGGRHAQLMSPGRPVSQGQLLETRSRTQELQQLVCNLGTKLIEVENQLSFHQAFLQQQHVNLASINSLCERLSTSPQQSWLSLDPVQQKIALITPNARCQLSRELQALQVKLQALTPVLEDLRAFAATPRGGVELPKERQEAYTSLKSLMDAIFDHTSKIGHLGFAIPQILNLTSIQTRIESSKKESRRAGKYTVEKAIEQVDRLLEEVRRILSWVSVSTTPYSEDPYPNGPLIESIDGNEELEGYQTARDSSDQSLDLSITTSSDQVSSQY